MASAPIWTPYCGQAPEPAALAGRWNLDPALLLALAAMAAVWFLWRRSGGGGRDALFAASIGLTLVIFVSPLCALSSALFAARTVHHALLVAGVAPLLAWAAPAPQGRFASLALLGLAHAAVFWSWHAPGLYAWALSSNLIYWLMQATLLGSALAFWRAVRGTPAPAAAAALLAVMVLTGLLGALLAFAGEPVYAPHLASTAAWGLTPLEDQQLAGLIMWAPMAGVYLLAALALVSRQIGRRAEAPC